MINIYPFGINMKYLYIYITVILLNFSLKTVSGIVVTAVAFAQPCFSVLLYGSAIELSNLRKVFFSH